MMMILMITIIMKMIMIIVALCDDGVDNEDEPYAAEAALVAK